MTDKEYEKQKKRVKKYWDKWFTALGLGWLDVKVYWERQADEEQSTTLGKTTVQWHYRQGSVTFFLSETAKETDDIVEKAVVHEMTHLLVGGLHDDRDDQSREITEYTVTTIAQALQWAREAGKRDQKKTAK